MKKLLILLFVLLGVFGVVYFLLGDMLEEKLAERS